MVESILVYIIVAAVLYIGGMSSYQMSISTCKSIKDSSLGPLLFSCIIYAIVFGARYDVGIDYLAYLRNYINAQSNINIILEKECGWQFFVYILAHNGFHFFFFFFIVAFIQIFFLLWGFKNYKKVIPFIGIVLMTGSFLTMMNGMRQYVVFSIVVWLIATFKRRTTLAYFFLILMCTTIHTSAIIFIPLYFYFKFPKDFTFNTIFQLITLSIFVIISYLGIFASELEWVRIASELAGYDKYSKLDLSSQINDSYNWGFRTLVYIGMIVLTILFDKKNRITFKSTQYSIFYNLFFWGSCFAIVFLNNNALRRLFDYFAFMSIIVYGYTLCRLYFEKNLSTKAYFKFVIYSIANLMVFAGTIYAGTNPENSAAFHFFFE